MDTVSRILIVQAPGGEPGPIERAARRAQPACTFELAETRDAYLQALERFRPELIISAYELDGFDGLDLLRLAAEHAPLAPVIIFTSPMGDEIAAECMRAGAAEYVTTRQPERLSAAIDRARAERRLGAARAQPRQLERETRFRAAHDNAAIGLYRTTIGGQIVKASTTMVRMLGYDSFDALARQNLQQAIFASDADRRAYCDMLENMERLFGLECTWITRSGEPLSVRVSATTIRDEQGAARYFDGIVEDMTEQRRVQAALRLSQFCLDHASVGIMRAGAGGRILNANYELGRMLGYSPAELCALAIGDIAPNYAADRAVARRSPRASPNTFESALLRKDGTRFPAQITHTDLQFGGEELQIVFIQDISDRKKAEENQARLEQQVLQFQKMESIGRLAGGVAHDFNNLITVIQGYCDLIEADLPYGAPLLDELGQIRLASQRAAALTAQLLAFGRKQILTPAVIDLNDLVANMRKMLERLIGEDITLITTLEPALRPVLADPAQLEQVIMNLVINARDAMPAGGTLVIETKNSVFDPAAPETQRLPGVVLTVSDTGTGMDVPTLERIFEPFFTTKEAGKGTGLGLATVYGIVKQSGGEITVTSRPGLGTRFRIVLPASVNSLPEQVAKPAPASATGGSETILVVEDDDLVRDLVRTILRAQGYTLLEAADGHEALAIAGEHRGPIDLLLTDVVMPHMGGRELAEQLRQLRPQIGVLVMSGYTDDAVLRHGLMTARIDFLAKPFSPMKLALKVREVLDSARGAASQSSHEYYDEALGVLTRTLAVSQGSTNNRSFAQAMAAQGSVLGMIGDLVAASDHFMRSREIFEALGDRASQARVLERLGWLAREQGDAAAALAWLDQSIGLSRTLGDWQHVAWVLLTMAGVAILQEDVDGAETLIEQATALHPESLDWYGWSANHQGQAAQVRGDYERAAQLHQQSLTIFLEQLGEKSAGMLWAYQSLGETALGQGQHEAAREWLHLALTNSRELGARGITAWCFSGLAGVAALRGENARAARLWGAAERLRAVLTCRPPPAARRTYERLHAQVAAQLGESAFAAAWAEGKALSLRQAIASALGEQ